MKKRIEDIFTDEDELRKIMRKSKRLLSIMITEDNWAFCVVGDRKDRIKLSDRESMIIPQVGLFPAFEFKLHLKDLLEYVEPTDKEDPNIDELVMALSIPIGRLSNASPIE